MSDVYCVSSVPAGPRKDIHSPVPEVGASLRYSEPNKIAPLQVRPLRRVLGLAAAVGATEISLSQLRAGAAALKPPVDIPVLFDALDRALRLRLIEEGGEGGQSNSPLITYVLRNTLLMSIGADGQ